jgi:hypothetical protein
MTRIAVARGGVSIEVLSDGGAIGGAVRHPGGSTLRRYPLVNRPVIFRLE